MKNTSFLTLILSSAALLAHADAADALAAAKAAAEEGKAVEGPATWNTTFSFGGAMTRGNSDTLTANARLATEKLLGETLFNGSVEGAYGEAEQTDADGVTRDETNVQNAKAAFGLKQRFDGVYGFLDGFVLTDDIADIDYRGMPSIGLGTFLADEDGLRISVQAGVGYLWEKVGDVEDDYATYVFGERATYSLSETANLWEEVSYIGSFEDSSDSLVNAELGADAALNETLKLGVVLKYTYDNTPAPDTEKDDLSLTAQISFQL